MEIREDVLRKLRRYCSYRERCHKEVRSKLLSLKVYGYDLENIISKLIEEDFLNEERFAKAYCTGKYRIKKWGKNKIANGLRMNQVNSYCIKKGLQEIDEEEYLDNLHQLLQKKLRQYNLEDKKIIKSKLVSFAFSKGYSYEDIKRMMPAFD